MPTRQTKTFAGALTEFQNKPSIPTQVWIRPDKPDGAGYIDPQVLIWGFNDLSEITMNDFGLMQGD